MVSMNTSLLRIQNESRYIMENMFPYYIYDMSEFMGWGPTDAGHYDMYDRSKFDIYWQSDDHVPFFIMADNELAGFILLRKYPEDESVYDIAQYFILRKFKRQGIGRQALKQIVSQFPGEWQIRVLTENTGALKFWLSAVSGIVGDNYQLTKETDVDLLMHFIRFDTRENK